ncbi:hypothetical protein ABIA69_000981 [Lysinibacillus parviboronicapiens]|uniref:Lipoprotein n=1 Tax=Lysinibacillus parviboronicapiens TaxID=436516 RepID=A0ABV2PFW8_9BACI
MFNKRRFKIGILLFIFTTVLFGCHNQNDNVQVPKGNLFNVFMGESKTWELSGYEIELTPNSSKFGNGILTMKNTTEYSSDFFSFEVHATINNKVEVMQKHQSSGEQVNIATKKMGSIEGNELPSKNGDYISINELSDIYMIIKWNDQQGNKKEERINLN